MRRATIWAAALVTPPAAGEGFVPVMQLRGLDIQAAAGSAEACRDFAGVDAEDFGPFDETLETTVACGDSAATAISAQTSSIGGTLLSVHNETLAETQLGEGEFVFLLAISAAGFNVTVDLESPARARLAGSLTVEAQAEVQPSLWVVSTVTWSSSEEMIFTETLQPDLNAGPAGQSFERIRRIDPGTYQLVAESTASVTDAIPVTGSFHAASAATLAVFHLADVDLDGTVGVTDLLALLAQWGRCSDCFGDIDGDGVVGVTDFLALLGAWGANGP